MKHRHLNIAIVSLMCCPFLPGPGASEAEENIPEGFSGVIDPGNSVRRRTDAYPLSDQENCGGWVLQEDDSDEFDGGRLDERKWYPRNPTWNGRKPTFFHPANVRVVDGQLVLALNRHGDEELPEGYTHTAGYIKSRRRFLFGYFEAELHCINAPWVSGFWLYHNDGDWWTEIDICENCPGVPSYRHQLNSNVHVFRAPEKHGDVKQHFAIPKQYWVPFELQAEPHVWGLEWDEHAIRFYFDGVLFREQKNSHWHQALEVNFNCESNAAFDALPIDSKVHEVYRVNYFRYWRVAKAGAEQDAPSDAGK